MTCPIAHYVDLPGYTLADVEAGCLIAHAMNEVSAAWDSDADADAAIEAYNALCRERLPEYDDHRRRTILFLAWKHDDLTPAGGER